MSFAFDDGWTQPDTPAVASVIEDSQRVVIRDHKRAQNIFNKIKANVEVQEDAEALDAYWQREILILDALHLFDPRVTDELTEVYEMHRSCLVHGGAARPAQPGNPQAQEPDGQDGKKGKDDDLWF